MAIDSALEAVRAGMDYERLRLDAASRNIANANVPVAHGKAATLWRVDGGVAAGGFARVAGSPDDLAIGEREAQAREVHDPGHPMANAEGIVRYPQVDLVLEMTTMMTASRGYEANVRSFNFLRNMMLRAIEIGAK